MPSLSAISRGFVGRRLVAVCCRHRARFRTDDPAKIVRARRPYRRVGEDQVDVVVRIEVKLLRLLNERIDVELLLIELTDERDWG